MLFCVVTRSIQYVRISNVSSLLRRYEPEPNNKAQGTEICLFFKATSTSSEVISKLSTGAGLSIPEKVSLEFPYEYYLRYTLIVPSGLFSTVYVSLLGSITVGIVIVFWPLQNKGFLRLKVEVN